LIALAAALVWTSASSADFSFRLPFVSVEVGSGVRVQAPFVNVQVPPALAIPAVPANPPTVVPLPAQPEGLPVPAPAVIRPMTLQEFAACFRPMPGRHEVLLLNPKTGCPTRVCFTLPCGCPCKVRVSKRQVEFDYGHERVAIVFGLCGRVRVKYH
jgi:hypothetical protein